MGKPATTYFCGNGHILEDNAHHEYGPRDMGAEECMCSEYTDNPKEYVPEPCSVCGSKRELMVTEWRDSDYWGIDDNGQALGDHPEVSVIPVKFERVERKDGYGNIYFEDVPVYGVSMLLARSL